MSILFKPILRPEPGVAGGGTPKYYASVHREQPVDIRRFVADVTRASTLNRADVHAAIQAFLELIPLYLADGKIVRLGDLGSFYANISSTGEESEAAVTSKSIKKAYVRFRASAEMKELVNNFKFQKLGQTLNGSQNEADSPTEEEAA